MLNNYQIQQTQTEKLCVALINAYVLNNNVEVIGKMNLLKHMAQPILHRRISKWKVLLSKLHLQFQAQQFVKEIEVLDFLPNHIVNRCEKNYDIPNKK